MTTMDLPVSIQEWGQASDIAEIRHTSEQGDNLDSYGYVEHDGRNYAKEEIVDGANNLKMTVSWLKSEDGQDWSVRVKGGAIDVCE